MPLKIALFFAAILSVVSQATYASDSFHTLIKKPKPPSETLLDKKIFVSFPDSEEITVAIKKDLQSRGYNIVDTEGESSEKLVFRSKFIVMGKGLSEVEGTFGDIVSAKKSLVPTEKNYAHQTVGIDHVAISAAATGGVSSISLTDFGMWLTQKMGIAGRFNEMLTGDPRGFCLSEGCHKFKQIVNLMYTGAAVGFVHVSANNESIVLDKVSSKAFSSLMDTFPRRESLSSTKHAVIEDSSK